MADVALKLLNTRGIPAIASVNVEAGTGTTTVSFNNHPQMNNRFAGGFWVKIAQTLATGSNVIQFDTVGVANSTIPVYLPGGDQATAADFESDGKSVFLCFYDRDANYLQLIK